MTRTRVIAVIFSLLCSSAWLRASDSPACKPVQHFGVTGCEILADQTCPKGYHRQVVDPPNPMMKAPSVLMCVADQAPAKKKPPKDHPKSTAGSPKEGLKGGVNIASR